MNEIEEQNALPTMMKAAPKRGTTMKVDQKKGTLNKAISFKNGREADNKKEEQYKLEWKMAKQKKREKKAANKVGKVSGKSNNKKLAFSVRN